MKLSMNQHEAMLFIANRELPTGAIHAGTLRALNLRGLVEPSEFEPCCPVPLPSRWRITQKGLDYLKQSREELKEVLHKLAKQGRS